MHKLNTDFNIRDFFIIIIESNLSMELKPSVTKWPTTRHSSKRIHDGCVCCTVPLTGCMSTKPKMAATEVIIRTNQVNCKSIRKRGPLLTNILNASYLYSKIMFDENQKLNCHFYLQGPQNEFNEWFYFILNTGFFIKDSEPLLTKHLYI